MIHASHTVPHLQHVCQLENIHVKLQHERKKNSIITPSEKQDEVMHFFNYIFQAVLCQMSSSLAVFKFSFIVRVCYLCL